MQLQSTNQQLFLELAAVIVKNKIEFPEQVDWTEYNKQLKTLFNKTYEKVDIEQCLDLLLGQQQDELIVYPDDHIQGI